MRKIKIMEHISLDGVIQHEDSDNFSHGNWTVPYRSQAGLEAVMEGQGDIFDLLLGRRTYDVWAGYWPNAGNSPIANNINAATKYIATHHPDTLPWGPLGDLGDNFIEGVRKLKATDGPDVIVWGSSTITSLLLEENLVDEVILITYPVLLGSGKRFFSDTVNPRELAFISTSTTPTGVLVNTYRHVGALAKVAG